MTAKTKNLALPAPTPSLSDEIKRTELNIRQFEWAKNKKQELSKNADFQKLGRVLNLT